jgi:hypothetical protein
VNGRGLPVAGWWLGFWIGPFAGLIPYVGGNGDPLARAHGKASMIFWAIAFVIWVPYVVVLFARGWSENTVPLAVGAGVMLLVSLGFCMVGTVQALRDRTLSGKALA